MPHCCLITRKRCNPSRGYTVPTFRLLPYGTVPNASGLNFCPHTGRDGGRAAVLRGTGISTHVPRTGHDGRSSSSLYALDVFQSTRPLRGATIVDGLRDDDKDKFQSTCPVRGTTEKVWPVYSRSAISIHVPRTGHDARSSWWQAWC